MEVRKRIVVEGKVQGVGYRYATQLKASKIGGLSGWVRNQEDGTVEMVVQGDEKQVDDLLAWCYRGSELSEVSRVVWTLLDPALPDAHFQAGVFHIVDTGRKNDRGRRQLASN